MALSASGIAAAAVTTGSGENIYRGNSGSADLEKSGYTGAGVTVAVIDTGVADVAAMGGSVVHQENISAAPPTGDQYGHGTFVAGLVHKTAPGAQIVSIKLSGADGSVDVTQVTAALQWVVEHRDQYGIDIVNLSFGSDSSQSPSISPLNYAVQKVWDAGIVVVASAGNLGAGSQTITKPADDPLVISVGAADDAVSVQPNDDTTPTFTSRGPTYDGLSKPDLVASGTSVISVRAPGSTADTNYPQARVGDDGFRGSGTSFAAPIVAGIAAQLLQARPDLTPDQVKYALVTAASPINADTAAQGAGMVSGDDALDIAGTGSANQGVTRGVGTGGNNGARGSFRVNVEVKVKVLGLGLVDRQVLIDGPKLPLLTDELPVASNLLNAVDTAATAPMPFVPEDFRASDNWDTRHWGSRHWGTSQWDSRHWGSTSWASGSWGASQWWATSWG
jgi:serine protease AprX